MAPLGPLRDLVAHEEQFLAGLREHVAEEKAEVRVFLPLVAGHHAEERAFAVDDFVVRERQGEVLAEGVNHAESQLALMMFAVDGFALEVAECVVHPAHVPLEAER